MATTTASALESPIPRQRLSNELERPTLPNTTQDEIVDFEEGDARNPRNWPRWRRMSIVILVSVSVMLSSMASSMIAPALGIITTDLELSSSFETQLSLSIFVLTLGLGTSLCAPLSEVYGRLPILQIGNCWFLALNCACGFAKTGPQMFVLRVLSGIGASAPLAVGIGMVQDCFAPAERGTAYSIYNLAPLFGPAFGAVLGGLVTQHMNWRYVFFITSASEGALILVGLFILSETYAPRILELRVRSLIARSGRTNLCTPYAKTRLPLRQLLPQALGRPLNMLAHEPITQLLTVYFAFLYGIMYLLYSTYASLWTTQYGESTSKAGWQYLALGGGYLAGSIACTAAVDRIYARLTRRSANVARPEFKLPMMLPAAVLAPTGLLIYGWGANAHLSPAIPALGAAIFASGTMIVLQCVNGYTVDCFARYAASASSANLILRSFAGFAFPIIGPAMWEKLGYGWASTMMGGVAVVLGVGVPGVLWRWGEVLRARSRYVGLND